MMPTKLMPLLRQPILNKFADVVHFTEYANSYHGIYEDLTVKLIKAESPELLDYMTIQFPPVEGGFAVFYGLAVGLFWLAVLPADTPVSGYLQEAFAQVAAGGVYEATFGDVQVSLTRRDDQFTLLAQVPHLGSKMVLGV